MKTKLLSVLFLAAGLLAIGARGQTPAPAVPASTDAVVAPAPGRIIYSPRLPTPIELTNVATAQGLSVERIDQTASQITATYKSTTGQLSTVAYQLLPTAANSAQATTVVATTTPAPTVVYMRPTPSYYYYDPFFYPWGPYGPVSVSLDLGFGFHGGHGYRGGFYYNRGHRRW